MNNEDEIKVSVFCTCYNHENYIRDCLDGFIMQETDFKFEVLVHDDASTDNSAKIIQEYVDKYPDIIKPIYQTENQYSQNIPIIQNFMLPKAKGKYIAFCEGDDFWTDKYKLQKQFDALEENKDCSLCVHKVKKIKHDTKKFLEYLPNKFDNDIKIRDGQLIKLRLQENQIFKVCSFFLTKYSYELFFSLNDKYFDLVKMGDMALLLFYSYYGITYYCNEVMANYRYAVPESWTMTAHKISSLNISDIEKSIASLQAFKKFSHNKFDSDIDQYLIKNYQIHLAQAYLYRIVKNKHKFKNYLQYKEQIKILTIKNIINNIIKIITEKNE